MRFELVPCTTCEGNKWRLLVDGTDHGQVFDTPEQVTPVMSRLAQQQLAAIDTVDVPVEVTLYIVPEGDETSDGRLVLADAIEWRDPPLPLMLQTVNEGGGHIGSVLAGHITEVFRDGNWIMGRATLHQNEAGRDLLRILGEQERYGLSADMGKQEVDYECRKMDEEGFCVDELMTFSFAELLGATATPFPAFAESRVELAGGARTDDDIDSEPAPETEPSTAGGLAADGGVLEVTGTVDLPVAPLETEWDGDAAAARVFEACTDDDQVDVGCVSRAFLWRDPDQDGTALADWSLGFADVIDGELHIVPSGVAATAGGRGVDQTEGIPADDVEAIKARICALYDTVRQVHEDWPECPFADDETVEPEVDEDLVEPIVEADGEMAAARTEFAPHGPFSGAMVALVPDNALQLAIDDYEPADQLHVTLRFLGKADQLSDEHKAEVLQAAADVAALHEAFDTEAFGTAAFNPGPDGACVLLFSDQTVLDIHQALADRIDNHPDAHPGFIPHLTLGYGLDCSDPAVMERVGSPIRFSTLRVAFGSDEIHDIPLAHADAQIPAREPQVDDPAAHSSPPAALSVETAMRRSLIDGRTVRGFGAGALTAAGMVADAFADPAFGEPGQDPRLVRDPDTGRWGCPMTVTDDGRMFGHAALWGTCHIGIAGKCVTPPSDDSGYAKFLLGDGLAADGSRRPVGVLTMATGHAPLNLSWRDATAHYDNTGTQAGPIAVGEDDYGIWFSGHVWPSIAADQEAMGRLRASKPSGDWRPIGGRHRLVAMLAVNTPGFPVPRAVAASVAWHTSDGDLVGLVASGMTLAPDATGDGAADPVAGRLAALERAEARRLRDRVAPAAAAVTAAKAQRLRDRVGV